MTTTKSPVSTWGVKIGFSLPRKRFAAFTATRPSTWLLASMIHHLRGTSLALAENVFMAAERARNVWVTGWGVNRRFRSLQRAKGGTAAAYKSHNEPLAFHLRFPRRHLRARGIRHGRPGRQLRGSDRSGDESRARKPRALCDFHRGTSRVLPRQP